MKTCCACGLTYRFNEVNNVSFHKFPHDETIRKAWSDAIKPNFSPSRSSVLCSKHFQENCFFYPPGGTKQRKHLKPGSLPTMFGFQLTKRSNTNTQKSNKMIKEKISVSIGLEHHSEQLIQDVLSNDIDVKQVEITPVIHDIWPEEIITEQDSDCRKYIKIPCKRRSRRYNPRFVGDCDPNDCKSPQKALRNWNLAMTYIETQRKKIRELQQQNRRLHKRVTELKIMLFRLKNKDLISKHAKKLLLLIQDTDSFDGN